MTIARHDQPMAQGRPVLQRSSRQSSLNDNLAWVMVVLVALAPIPFGSNRPFFWATNAAIVGLVGAVYLWRLGSIGEPLRRGLGSVRLPATLYGLVCLWLVVQTVPVGILGPLAEFIRPFLTITTAEGMTILPDTISLVPDATLLMLLRWVTFGVFFLLVLQLTSNQRRRELMLNAIVAITTAYAVFGLASLLQFGDTILGMEKWVHEGSATGTFVNRNSFATFLAFGAVTAVAQIFGTFVGQIKEGERAPARLQIDPVIVLHLVALGAIVAALLASQSRMGTFAAVTGVVVVTLLGISRVPGLWTRALMLLPPIAITLCLALYVFGQGLLDRLGSIESSADVRFDLYKQVVGMIEARPWFGYGGGSFELAYPLYHRLPVSADLVWDRAHNSYLALFAEIGVIAGGAILLILAVSFVRILASLGSARLGWPARAAALGALIVGAIHSLTDFSLEMQANTFLFLLLLALGSAQQTPQPTTSDAAPIRQTRA